MPTASLLLALAPLVGDPVSLGPFGGQHLALDADPTDPDVVLLSSVEQGLLRSDDGGATFQPTGLGLPGPGFGTVPTLLRRDPADPTRLVAAVGSQLYLSTTDGAAWDPVPVFTGDGIRAFAFAGDGSWVAATNSEIFRTTDGVQWTSVGQGSVIADLAFSPTAPPLGYAATIDGVLRTLDFGATWDPVGTDTSWAKTVAVDPTDALVVYRAGIGGSAKRSVDGGVNWTPIDVPGGSSATFFAWDPQVAGRLWLGALARLHYTDDGGQNWVNAGASLPASQPILTDLAWVGGDLLLSSENGLFEADAATPPWALIGLPSVETWGAFVAEPGGGRLVTNFKGVYASAGPQAPLEQSGWFFDFGAHTNDLVVDAANSDRWILGGVGAFIDNATIRVATNGGQTIQTPVEIFGAGQCTALDADPFDPRTMVAAFSPLGFGGDGLMRSTNSGASWSPVAGTAGGAWATVDVAYDPTTPGRLAALNLSGQVRVSTNGGQSFTSPGSLPGGGQPVLIDYDPLREGFLYAARAGLGLHRSDDGGQTWTPLGQGAHPRSKLAFDPVQPGLLWYSNDAGEVVRSDDGGDSWVVAFDTPGGSLAGGLALDSLSGDLVVATLGESAWELPNASPYGDLGGGVAGAGGLEPRFEPTGGLPELGSNTWTLRCVDLVGGSVAVLHVGASDLGLPFLGGTLHTGLPTAVLKSFATGGTPGGAGEGQIAPTLPVPGGASFAGATVYAQVFGLDAAGPEGFSVSDGLAVTIL